MSLNTAKVIAGTPMKVRRGYWDAWSLTNVEGTDNAHSPYVYLEKRDEVVAGDEKSARHQFYRAQTYQSRWMSSWKKAGWHLRWPEEQIRRHIEAYLIRGRHGGNKIVTASWSSGEQKDCLLIGNIHLDIRGKDNCRIHHQATARWRDEMKMGWSRTVGHFPPLHHQLQMETWWQGCTSLSGTEDYIWSGYIIQNRQMLKTMNKWLDQHLKTWAGFVRKLEGRAVTQY